MLATIRKALVAAFSGAVAALVTAAQDGSIEATDWVTVALAAVLAMEVEDLCRQFGVREVLGAHGEPRHVARNERALELRAGLGQRTLDLVERLTGRDERPERAGERCEGGCLVGSNARGRLQRFSLESFPGVEPGSLARDDFRRFNGEDGGNAGSLVVLHTS